uniref:Uncharacterized protein n=1 Tax=Arundo donax TaxID=35708 RepID=A0A0A8YA96_ARUDO
MMAPSHYHP